MGWVLLEIIVPLLIALAIGVFIGWLLWRWRHTAMSWDEYQRAGGSSNRTGELEAEVKRLTVERDAATKLASDRDTELIDLRGQVAGFAALPDADADLDAATHALGSSAGDTVRVDAGDLAAARAAAKTGDTAAKTGDTAAKTGDTAAKTGGAAAKTGDAAAKLEGAAAKTGDTAAKTGDTAAKTGDTAAKTGDTAAKLGGAAALVGGGIGAAATGSDDTVIVDPAELAAARAAGATADDADIDLRDSGADGDDIDLRPDASGNTPGDGSSGGGGASGPTGDGRTTLVGASVASKAATAAAPAPALAAGAVRHPYGEGSHGPLADNSTPDGYIVKGNVDSMLYHRPDSRSYRATIAEVWFDTPATARAAGFAKARSHPDLSPADEAIADHLDGTSGIAGKTATPSAPLAPGAERHPYGEGSHGPLADNGTPDGYIVKGNVDSMLYHRPDSRSYRATIAEVWFDTPATARAAGFAKARSHPDLSPADEAIADHLDGATAGTSGIAGTTGNPTKPLAPDAQRHPYGDGSHGPLADNSTPDGYIVKGNIDSMLYHRPDSRSYRATIAEVWFDTPERAEQAGFAKASSHPKD